MDNKRLRHFLLYIIGITILLFLIAYLSIIGYIIFVAFIPLSIALFKQNPFTSIIVTSVILSTFIFIKRKYKNKPISLWTRTIMELLIIPIVVTAIAFYIVNGASFTMSESTLLVLKAIVLYSASTIYTLLWLNHKKHDVDFLKLSKVFLDYLDSLYWILLTVILFLFVFPDTNELNQNTFKFLIFPLIIQTKIAKAYIGHISLNLNEDPRPIWFQKLATFILKSIYAVINLFYKIFKIKNQKR